MKKLFFIIPALMLALTATAQQARKDFKRDITLSASNYVAYPGPQKALTPAPKGYTPYYISHYGRHGSRYLIGTNDYERPYDMLLKAQKLGLLTAKGEETLAKIKTIKDEAWKRDGELTLRGAEQHRGIAKRMYERFPEVFKGDVRVDAKSTIVIRCILSMENALQQLKAMNPKLDIRHDASEHDMWYMNFDDKKLFSKRMPKEAKEAYDAFSKKHENYEKTMRKIFNNETYWRDSIDASWLGDRLFKLASNIQSTELRHTISLYDLFDEDQIYDFWLRNNAWWYINYGPSPLNGGTQPYSQRNLLKMIIHEADSCLKLKAPGATLRYGHDTMVMPLTCLLNINGTGKQIADLEQIDDEGWNNYRIFPMACNLQFVFYRKAGSEDIIFKILDNEDEATLPIKTDIAPYYHWNDFKDYCNKILSKYED